MSGYRPVGPEFGRASVRIRRPDPPVVVWRWRYELGAASALVGLAACVGAPWAVLVGLACAGAAVLAPVRRRVWVVVTQHRIRTGFAHAWLHSRTGRLPMLLWTRSVPEGEQVLVWLRPGMSVDDLVDAAPALAATCWAREVVAEQDPDHGHVVRVTVVRS